MLEHDNFFTAMSQVSVGMAMFAPAWLLFTSLLHFALAGIRKLRRKPARLEWWVGGRVLTTIGIILAVIALAIAMGFQPEWIGGFASMAIIFSIFSAPMLLTIIKMRVVDTKTFHLRSRAGRIWQGIKTVFMVFALPGTIALATTMLPMVDQRFVEGRSVNEHEGKYFYMMTPTICSNAMRSVMPYAADGQRKTEDLTLVGEFWMDQTLDAMTLGLLDSTGCNFRRIDYSRDDVRMDALGMGYNLLLIFVVTAIFYSLVRKPKPEPAAP